LLQRNNHRPAAGAVAGYGVAGYRIRRPSTVFDDDDNPRRISILTVPLSPMKGKGAVPEQ